MTADASGIYTMTLQHADGTVVARDLLCQLDTVNIDLILSSGGMIPNDSFDLYSLGWNSPVPVRGDYFVDQNDNTPYQVFGRPAVYTSHVECRVTLYLSKVP